MKQITIRYVTGMCYKYIYNIIKKILVVGINKQIKIVLEKYLLRVR